MISKKRLRITGCSKAMHCVREDYFEKISEIVIFTIERKSLLILRMRMWWIFTMAFEHFRFLKQAKPTIHIICMLHLKSGQVNAKNSVKK